VVVTKPQTTAAMTKPAVAPKPAAKPAQTLTIASIVAGAGVAKSPPKPAAPPAPAPTAAGSWVQIGAFSSAALADKGWSDVAKLDPDAMKGKGKKVEPVTAGDKSLYRTYITGFASRDAAAAFCGTLKAAGKACFVK
jgi:cell division protein FtsN